MVLYLSCGFPRSWSTSSCGFKAGRIPLLVFALLALLFCDCCLVFFCWVENRQLSVECSVLVVVLRVVDRLLCVVECVGSMPVSFLVGVVL